MNIETVSFLIPLLLVGIIFQFTPLLTRRGVFFSANVAPDFPQSSDGRRLLRSYRWQAALWCAAAVVLTAILVPQYPLFGSMAPLFFLIAGIAFTYSRKFHKVHTRYGTARPEIRRASLESSDRGESLSLRLDLPPFLAMAAVAIYLRLIWNQIPQHFPARWSLQGEPVEWATRTWLGVYGNLLIGLAINVFSLALAWLIARLSRKTMMRYVTVRSMEMLLYPLTLMFIALSFLPLLPKPMWIISCGIAVIWLGIAGVLYWSYRKLHTVSAAEDAVPEPQSDSYWKAGMFYYNPDDPAIFVSKRVGVGYSLNFASKWAWVFLGMTILFIAASVLLGEHAKS